MAVLAKHCPDVRVTVVDLDKRRVDAWNSDELPIYEPGLAGVISETLGRNLFITTDVEAGIRDSDIIFIAVNTSTKAFGHWAGHGYDLSAYEGASRSIARYATSSKIVVEKSTVPVLTAKRIRSVFDANAATPDVKFEVISNPEFLAEGTAIRDLEAPDRVLIGGLQTPSGRRAVEALASLYAHWVPEERILKTGLWSSELSKLACNAMLAQRVSSVNALSAICEKTGADVAEVSHVMGKDSRIGSKFLNASVGFGGSCFGKDLLGLIYLSRSFELDEVADYWEGVLKINTYQKLRFSKLIVQEMFGNVKRKNICVLGYAFKKNTGDTRESPAIDVVRFLTGELANVFVYDPKVKATEIKEEFPSVTVESTAYKAALEAHALVILTEWDEFKTLDYAKIYKNMAKPAFIFDGRNLLDHRALAKIGFRVFCIGKGFLMNYKSITDPGAGDNTISSVHQRTMSGAEPVDSVDKDGYQVHIEPVASADTVTL
jgi:UDPglucose 6-dehydrogenase